jgi:transposase
VVISQVARRRGLTPQQLFTWRREARHKVGSDGVPFTPVIVEPLEAAPATLMSESMAVSVRPHVIELDIDGASVWIWREADGGMVTAIIDALKAGS